MQSAGLDEAQAGIKIARMPGASTGVPTYAKGHAEETGQAKADQASREPLDLLEHLPQNQNLSVLLLWAFHQLF